MDLVPYRDDEVAIAGPGEIVRKRPAASIERALEVLAEKSPPPPEDGVGDLDAARAHVRELAWPVGHRLISHQGSGRVLGSPKCRKRLVSANQVIAAIASPRA